MSHPGWGSNLPKTPNHLSRGRSGPLRHPKHLQGAQLRRLRRKRNRGNRSISVSLCILIMVLNPGQLPPPALRLALPRASSHAAPGDAGRVFPEGCAHPLSPPPIQLRAGVFDHPQTHPAPYQGLWPPPPNARPQKHPPGRLAQGRTGGVPELCAPRAGAAGLRRSLNPPGSDVCVHRGAACEPRGVCLCVCVCRERAISTKLFFLLFFFFFFPRRLLQGCLA